MLNRRSFLSALAAALALLPLGRFKRAKAESYDAKDYVDFIWGDFAVDSCSCEAVKRAGLAIEPRFMDVAYSGIAPDGKCGKGTYDRQTGALWLG